MDLGFRMFTDPKREKRTYFIEKILASLPASQGHPFTSRLAELKNNYYDERDWHAPLARTGSSYVPHLFNQPWAPKIHTIRPDTTRRWQTGRPLNFVAFSRTKYRWVFASAECTGVQTIYLKTRADRPMDIRIDGRPIETLGLTREQFAVNDGFADYEDFLTWFTPLASRRMGFTGRIIHWTDTVY